MVKRWGEKRYYSLDHYLKNTYGEKLYKISLDGGMTCPNRDGTLGRRGCIFCSAGGSGDFASDRKLSITEQIEQGKRQVAAKHPGTSYIAYFQAYTNTYAPVAYLRDVFMEAIRHPEVKILSIATRPDCLGEDVLKLLDELNQIKPVWIELGLQTIHPDTARFIRRGYDLPVFEQAVSRLRLLNIDVIVHTILKNTDLAGYYEKHPFYLPSMEEYFGILGQCLCALSPDIVIHRLTGDGPKPLLIAPLWTGNKRQVLNQMQAYFKKQDIWQGKEL